MSVSAPHLIFVNRTHHLFTRTEQKFLLELQQIEHVLRTASLEVDLSQELAYEHNDIRYLLFISGLFWCLLEHGLREQRVARASRVVGFVR